MTPPEGIYFPRPRSGTGWFVIGMVLVGAAAVWLWNERRERPQAEPRPIAVATADSSGTMTTPDTITQPAPGNPNIPSAVPAPVTPEIFVASAPGFQSPSAVPVGNFLDYARQMQFDPSRGQDLQLPTDQFGRQPVIHLEPLTNLRRLDSLAFSQGRIIARIRSDIPYPALDLRSGDNFLWIRGTVGGTLPGELWTTSALASFRQISLSYSPRAPADIPAGKDAWWVGDENGRQLWIICGRGWCHN
jgi:hypothetical protein